MREKVETKRYRLLTNMLIIGVGTILTKMISFLLIPFYTNWLSTEEFGKYDLIATYVSLCVPFVTLQLDQALYRYSVETPNESNIYFRMIMRVIIPLMCLASVAIYFIMCAISYDEYAIGFIAYFSMLILYNCSAEFLRGNEKLVDYSVHNILVGVITVVASVYLVYYKRLGVSGMLWVYALAYGVSMLLIMARFKPYKVIKKRKEFEKLKIFLRFSVPLIPNSISWWITNVSDRTVIDVIMGSHFNGLYAIACKIPTVLSLLFSVFNLSFQQVAIQSQDDSDRKEYFNELVGKLTIVLFSGSLIIVSATPILYYNFVNSQYWDGIAVVPVLLCGAIYLSLAQCLGDILLAQKRTKIIGISTIVSAIINIILNILLIKSKGLIGAAIATFTAYIFMFVIRAYKLSDEINVFLLGIKVVVYSALYFILSSVILWIGQDTLWSTIILGIFVMVFFVLNRDIILRIIRKRK